MRGRKRWSNDALLWNGFPFRCLWFVVQLFMGQAQELNWGKTIDVAGRRRMLTQRMSKEFLQVALDIDAADNRGRMLGSINLFNVSLYQLINGDSVTGIVGTPNHLVGSGLDEVVSLWKPFSQLLLNNVDTIRDASGFVDMNIISMVEAQNVPVLVKSNVVVGRPAYALFLPAAVGLALALYYLSVTYQDFKERSVGMISYADLCGTDAFQLKQLFFLSAECVEPVWSMSKEEFEESQRQVQPTVRGEKKLPKTAQELLKEMEAK